MCMNVSKISMTELNKFFVCLHIPYLYGLFSSVLFLDDPQYIPVV